MMSKTPDPFPYLHLLQVVNGALMITLISMVVFFLVYVVRKWWEWLNYDGRSFYGEVKPALAMLVFVLGEGVVRFAVWNHGYAIINGTEDVINKTHTAILIIGGAIAAVVGGLCVVRVFSPARYHGVPWALTIMVIALFMWWTWS